MDDVQDPAYPLDRNLWLIQDFVHQWSQASRLAQPARCASTEEVVMAEKVANYFLPQRKTQLGGSGGLSKSAYHLHKPDNKPCYPRDLPN